MVAMEVAAAKATEEPREGRARRKERKAASQTVRMGERNLSSTLWKKCGCSCQFLLNLCWKGRTYDSTITCKSKHHTGVGGHGEQSTMPYANHNKTHENHRAIGAEDVNENLEDGLTIVACDSGVEVLDTEEETENNEEAK